MSEERDPRVVVLEMAVAVAKREKIARSRRKMIGVGALAMVPEMAFVAGQAVTVRVAEDDSVTVTFGTPVDIDVNNQLGGGE